MNSFSDVIIIGAGPAGCACALALKESGLSVLVLEKSSFPRDKVCGDAIGSRVKSVLRKIDPELEKRLAIFEDKSLSTGWKLFSPGGKSVKVDFVNTGYVSKRYDFDNFLFQEVAKGNTKILTGVEIKSFNADDIYPEVIDQSGIKYKAKIIVGCDGAHSSIVRSAKPFSHLPDHHSGSVRTYFESVKGIEKNILEIHLVKNFLPGYFWIFPVNDRISNVGFGMLTADISKRRIDLKKAIFDIIDSTPHLNERFRNAKQLGELKGFGLPLGGLKRNLSGKGFLLCGDAASLIDPLNGEGIGNAMLSGFEAARQIESCFKSGNFSAAFLRTYDERINTVLNTELRNKLFLQKLFNRPWLINSLVSLGASNKFIRNWVGRKL